jgi:beta-N-acetylhexosaminidase
MPAVLLTPGPSVREQDLLPYKRAIEQGAPILHVGNTLVPTLDSEDHPASLSPVVIGDILRTELKFKGVIVAGPMDSNDIAMRTDPTQAALMAIKAGADMVLWNQAGRRVMKTVDELVGAVQRGDIRETAIDTAVTRILEMKRRYGLRGRPVPKSKNAESLSKKSTYAQEAYDIDRRSITLVQNHGNVLPLTRNGSTPVGITGAAGVSELRAALQKPLKAVVEQPIATAKYGGEIYDFEIDRLTSGGEGIKTVIIVVSPEITVRSQILLLDKLKAKGARVVVVLVGYPKMLPQLAGADAILLAYCEPAAVGPAMRAVAEVLLGRAPVGFLPTVADVRMSVGKAETYDLLNLVRTPSGRLPVSFDPPFTAGLAVPYDPSQAIKKVLWDFGDGSKAKTVQVSHAYQSAGRYPITVTITDLDGQTTSHTLYAQVE